MILAVAVADTLDCSLELVVRHQDRVYYHFRSRYGSAGPSYEPWVRHRAARDDNHPQHSVLPFPDHCNAQFDLHSVGGFLESSIDAGTHQPAAGIGGRRMAALASQQVHSGKHTVAAGRMGAGFVYEGDLAGCVAGSLVAGSSPVAEAGGAGSLRRWTNAVGKGAAVTARHMEKVRYYFVRIEPAGCTVGRSRIRRNLT